MNTEKQKIAIACFLGGLIGALIALQIGHLWWLGVLIGGAVGYVAYSFHEIPKAAARVWNTRPSRAAVKMAKEELVNIISALILAPTLFIGLLSLMSTLDIITYIGKRGYGGMIDIILENPYLFYIGGSLYTVFVAVLTRYYSDLEKERREKFFLFVLSCAPLLTPIALATVVVKLAPFCVQALIFVLMESGKLYWHLGRKIFLLVHSELRLLCMTDAMLGAIIGYLSGHAIVGGIAGAALGVLNFELVSKRWLKLASAQQ